MNRAWIPAGALAGVSVAGLLALGPMTDSLGTKVAFPADAATVQPPAPAPASVPVSINMGPTGETSTTQAALHSKGGRVAAETSSAGQVTLKVRSGKRATPSTTTTRTSAPTYKTIVPKATPKKAVMPKRQTSIGDIGESNSDHGLAGQSQQTSSGGQNATPKPAP